MPLSERHSRASGNLSLIVYLFKDISPQRLHIFCRRPGHVQ